MSSFPSWDDRTSITLDLKSGKRFVSALSLERSTNIEPVPFKRLNLREHEAGHMFSVVSKVLHALKPVLLFDSGDFSL